MKILEHTPTRLVLYHEPVEQWLRGAAVTVFGLFSSALRVFYFVTFPWWFIFFEFYFIAGGLYYALVLSEVVTYAFDKSLDNLTVTRKNLFGTKVIRHSIQEISFFELKRDSATCYRHRFISIVLSSSKALPLNRGGSYSSEERQKTVNCLRGFLSIPWRL